MSGGDEMRFEVDRGVAVVTLDRPKALNALTLGMIRALDPQLAAWAGDPAVRVVVVRGAGDRAFCAGGDVRAVYEDRAKGGTLRADFFREEYRLNRRIFHYPKPYVALMDGITMGGGVGLSVHGSHRVASERLMLAMPETGIGLFPDVGGSWFLPRCPGEVGMYMVLTGARLDAADCRYAGIVDAVVPSDRHDDLVAALRAGASPDAALRRHAVPPGKARLAAMRADIDRCFAGGSVEEVLDALSAAGGDWGRETADAIAAKSPTSLKVSFRQLRTGAGMTFDACMVMEYRLSQHVMAGHDFYEGVRAALVDRDQAPHWRPERLRDVDDAIVAAHFAPLGKRELSFT